MREMGVLWMQTFGTDVNQTHWEPSFIDVWLNLFTSCLLANPVENSLWITTRVKRENRYWKTKFSEKNTIRYLEARTGI